MRIQIINAIIMYDHLHNLQPYHKRQIICEREILARLSLTLNFSIYNYSVPNILGCIKLQGIKKTPKRDSVTRFSTTVFWRKRIWPRGLNRLTLVTLPSMILSGPPGPLEGCLSVVMTLIPSKFALWCAVLRIRIYYYVDPDPGSKKCPYGSGSGS